MGPSSVFSMVPVSTLIIVTGFPVMALVREGEGVPGSGLEGVFLLLFGVFDPF